MYSYRKELQKQPVLSIAELEFENAVGANLRDRGQPSSSEELSQSRNESGRRCSRCSDKLGCVATKPCVDDQLLLVVGFGELEQQYLG